MAGRAALVAVLLLVATCAWANPISRDDLETLSVAAQVPKGPETPPAPSAANNQTTSEDAPNPAQSVKAAEQEESESTVTDAPAPQEAAEKVAAPVEEEAESTATDAPAPVEAAKKVAAPVEEEAESTATDAPAPVEAAEKVAAPVEEEAESSVTDAPAPVEASEKVAAPVEEEAEPTVTDAPAPEEAAEKVAVSVEEEAESSVTDAPTPVEAAEKVSVPEAEEEESPVTEGTVEAAKNETVQAKKQPTIVEKVVLQRSEAVLSEDEEATTLAPVDQAEAVEKASPSSPEDPEIVEEITTISPAADEETIAERLRSGQIESADSETTEKNEIETDSLNKKETEPAKDAAPVVEKSIDGADSQGDEEPSSATEAIPVTESADQIKVVRIQANKVASPVEDEIVVTEVAVEATTVIVEEAQEAVERDPIEEEAAETTTPFTDAGEREDVTEAPVDRIAEESSGVEIVTAISVESEDGSFRQGEIDIAEASEDEDISSTTIIPQSEQDIKADIREEDETTDEPSTDSPIDRMDSATDITTEQPKEELIQAESVINEVEVNAEQDVVTDAPEAEEEESGSIHMRDEGAQAITTEATVEEITEIVSSQTFDDAAPIQVVEIKESNKPVENIVPEDSAPIEIVEITEKSQPLAAEKVDQNPQAVDERESTAAEPEISETTEVIPNEREEATTIPSESAAIRDDQEMPSSSVSEQDQEAEEGDDKTNDSKIQPAAGDYWLSMQAEGNKSAQAAAKPAKSSTTAEEVADEVIEEAEDIVVNIREGESAPAAVVAPAVAGAADDVAPSVAVPATDIAPAVVTPAAAVTPAVAAPAADVIAAVETPEETSIDDKIAKVAQKYGLQSVGKVTSEAKPVEEVAAEPQVVSDADVPKEDSIYLGNESKKSDFQESNALQRRHSFGDKVVRFVRSFL